MSRFDVVACVAGDSSCLNSNSWFVLPWSPTKISQEYSVGTTGSTTCSGKQCDFGTNSSPPCLTYSCVSEMAIENAGYEGRLFSHEDVFRVIQPTHVPAHGGVSLTVSGNGFIPNATYLAIFFRGNSTMLTQSDTCTISEISFTSPAWGQRFAAAHTQHGRQSMLVWLQLFRLSNLGPLASHSDEEFVILGLSLIHI